MKKTWATLAVALGGLCVVSAEAGSVDLPFQIGGAFSVPAISIKEARFSAMVRQQYDFSCGSAALSTLLTYHYRFPVNEQTVFEEMFAQGDQEKIKKEGFSLLDMKRYLEAHGYEADGFEAPLDKLASAQIPAIVLINENGYNHFVVVKGIRDQRVLIGDPSGGTRALARSAFEALWVNQILFVISNRQDVAGFNQASDWSVAVRAPIGSGINRQGLGQLVIPKLGSSDF
ncbi:MAG TPA: C39 family peptidase [Caldimonas sp.]